jgi:hypothetical protein
MMPHRARPRVSATTAREAMVGLAPPQRHQSAHVKDARCPDWVPTPSSISS